MKKRVASGLLLATDAKLTQIVSAKACQSPHIWNMFFSWPSGIDGIPIESASEPVVPWLVLSSPSTINTIFYYCYSILSPHLSPQLDWGPVFPRCARCHFIMNYDQKES